MWITIAIYNQYTISFIVFPGFFFKQDLGQDALYGYEKEINDLQGAIAEKRI
jgi:hypothetical protein